MENEKIPNNTKTPLNSGGIMKMAGKDIGIKDKNGNNIFVGSVIEHNNNLYLIKWSDSQQQFVARAEPTAGERMNWRDERWIINLADKYIEIVGEILYDKQMRTRFSGAYR